MGQSASQYVMNSRFSVCVCVSTFQFNYLRQTWANLKHLRVSSEVCSGTHSSHDSFKLSQAHARFPPPLPIITRHFDLCPFLTWNIWDNIQLNKRSTWTNKDPEGDHLSCIGKHHFSLEERRSCTPLLARHHNLLAILMFRSPTDRRQECFKQFWPQWSQIMLRPLLVLRWRSLIVQWECLSIADVFNLSQYIPHERKRQRKDTGTNEIL